MKFLSFLALLLAASPAFSADGDLSIQDKQKAFELICVPGALEKSVPASDLAAEKASLQSVHDFLLNPEPVLAGYAVTLANFQVAFEDRMMAMVSLSVYCGVAETLNEAVATGAVCRDGRGQEIGGIPHAAERCERAMKALEQK